MRNTGPFLTRGIFALLLAAVLPPQAEAGQWWFRVQNLPAVVAQTGVVTGSPSTQPCPQGAGLGDGCPMVSIGNGLGTVQHADFFTGYAAQTSSKQAALIAAQLLPARPQYTARPAWNLPGIDYPVGILPGKTLLDPVDPANASKLPKGCAIFTSGTVGDHSYTMVCNGFTVGSAGGSLKASDQYTPLLIDSWDFSLHGGIRFSWSNWKGTIALTNNKIGGDGAHNRGLNGNAWFTLESTNVADQTGGYACFGAPGGCVKIQNNWVDGNIPNDLSINAGIFSVNEGFDYKYNYTLNVPVRIVTSASFQRPTLQDYCSFQYNYVEGMINPGNQTGGHGEVTLTNGPCGNYENSYNTMLEPTRSGFVWQNKDLYPQVSGWVYTYPSATIVAGRCSNVTFSGTTGTVNESCTGTQVGQQNVTYGVGTPVSLVVTDGSGQIINGTVTQINGKDPIHYRNELPTSFTMSLPNTITTGVNLRLSVQAPSYAAHHNVFVNNAFEGGSTNFGSAIGQLGGMTWDYLTVDNNWFDPTGSYGCFGAGFAAEMAASPGSHPGVNYNLTNSGGLITGYSSTDASGCVGRYQGHSFQNDY